MEPAISQLLEAHVQHELALFKPRKLRQTIREEVAALYRWLHAVKLSDVVTPEQVLGLIARNVVERPLPVAVSVLAKTMSRLVLSSRHNNQTTVEQICTRRSFDAVVARIGGLKDARRSLIHRLVSSTVYTQQISDVLFTGIKEYLLTENILAQKVPGLASLIKLGKFAVNKTMRPLEAAVEKTVKAYIEGNLGNTIRRSEQSINDYFDEARIAALGEALWRAVGSRRVAEFMRILDGDDLDDLVAIGLDFWLQFRKTPYFKAMYTDLVHAFFERYAKTPVSLMAADFGVTEKLVADELMHGLAHGVDQALASGYLEQRIRAHLGDFYASAEAARWMAGLAHPTAAKAPVAARKAAPRKPVAAARKVAAGKPPANEKVVAPARRKKPG
ncbi:MAG TPA: hypothetical protein VN259_14260 [Xanthomonadales bacterium]|nr:hypothetical protein [Xanthomonadales bacterium]